MHVGNIIKHYNTTVYHIAIEVSMKFWWLVKSSSVARTFDALKFAVLLQPYH